MLRRPPRSTRTDTLFPYTTLFRSDGDEQSTGRHHRLAVAVLAGHFHADRQPRVFLDPVLGNQASVVARAAGDDVQAAGSLQQRTAVDAEDVRQHAVRTDARPQIGRESTRERGGPHVLLPVVAVRLKKKNNTTK